MAMERVQRALDASEIVGQEEGPCAVSYTSRDLIIYALGVGAADLMYLHEGGGSFSSFPTFPLVLPYKGTSDDIVPFPGPTLFLIPEGLRDAVEPGAILHYDQSIRVLEPLDPGGAELESRSVVLGVYRRRGGALLRTKTTLTDTSSGRTMAETTQGTFIRGLKILGDAGPPLPPRPPRPTRPPDAAVAVTIPAQQALLYRLSGDYNAIHVDPGAARAAGLEKPILHGLCSLGIATVQVLRHFCPKDPSGLASLGCRFSRAVFPGDVIEVKMWGENASSRDHQEGVSVGHERADSTAAAAAAAAAERVDAGLDGRAAVGRSKDEDENANHRVETRRSTPVSTKPAGSNQQQQQQVVRFEVCSPGQGGAVVVADGRAVLKPPRLGVGGVETGGAPRNRARL